MEIRFGDFGLACAALRRSSLGVDLFGSWSITARSIDSAPGQTESPTRPKLQWVGLAFVGAVLRL